MIKWLSKYLTIAQPHPSDAETRQIAPAPKPAPDPAEENSARLAVEQVVQRRRYLRVATRIPMECTISMKNGKEKVSTGEMLDLSLGGARLRAAGITRSDVALILGGDRRIVFWGHSPGWTAPIQCSGKVVWLDFHDRSNEERSYAMIGIAFNPMPVAAENELEVRIRSLGDASMGRRDLSDTGTGTGA